MMKTACCLSIALLALWWITQIHGSTLCAEERVLEIHSEPSPTDATRFNLLAQKRSEEIFRFEKGRGLVGWKDQGDNRIWLRFDLKDLPPKAFIVSAVVRLWQDQCTGAVNKHRLDLCTCLKPVLSHQCSWQYFAEKQPWAEPGAAATAGDQPDRQEAAATVELDDQPMRWRQWDVTTAVQAMADGAPNHGFVLFDRDIDPKSRIAAYVSFTVPEDTFQARRPTLLIRYSDAPVERTPDKAMLTPQPPVQVVRGFVKYREGQLPFDGYGGTQWAMIHSAAPTTNNACDPDRIVVGRGEGWGESRALLRFARLNDTHLPVANAFLVLTGPRQQMLREMHLSRVSAPWRLQEVSWSEASWNHPWRQSGGDGTELRLPVSATEVENDLVLRYEITDWVKDWLKHPDTNHGIMLRLRSGKVHLYADNQPVPQRRPTLEIEFSTGAQP